MKDDFWRTFGKAVIGLLIWGVALILSTGCYTTEVVRIPFSGDVLASTICTQSGKPIILMHTPLDSIVEQYILVHEMHHVRQVREFGDCRAFMQRFNTDRVFAFENEVEAYCVSFAYRREQGQQNVTRGFVKYLVFAFGEANCWDEAEIKKRIPCDVRP